MEIGFGSTRCCKTQKTTRERARSPEERAISGKVQSPAARALGRDTADDNRIHTRSEQDE